MIKISYCVVIVMVCFIILVVFGAQISADVQAHSRVTGDDVSFLPRCMECRRGLAMRILSICPSVCLSVYQTRASIVTKRKKGVSRFLYHTKDYLA